MRRFVDKVLHQDDGIGIASALAVAIVIFILGGVWYSVSLHELEEVGYDRHLATAVNVAEAGAREAMYLLASNDGGFRDDADDGEATTGITGTTCDLDSLEIVVDGVPEALGAGTKPSEFLVNVVAAAHIFFFQAALFGKADILDVPFLGFCQIVFGCETAVKSNLEWIPTVDLLLTIKHLLDQICVGGIAFKDHTVQDQV